jgi:hypothetical protein
MPSFIRHLSATLLAVAVVAKAEIEIAIIHVPLCICGPFGSIVCASHCMNILQIMRAFPKAFPED